MVKTMANTPQSVLPCCYCSAGHSTERNFSSSSSIILALQIRASFHHSNIPKKLVKRKSASICFSCFCSMQTCYQCIDVLHALTMGTPILQGRPHFYIKLWRGPYFIKAYILWGPEIFLTQSFYHFFFH